MEDEDIKSFVPVVSFVVNDWLPGIYGCSAWLLVPGAIFFTACPDGRAASRVGCKLFAPREVLEDLIRLFVIDL